MGSCQSNLWKYTYLNLLIYIKIQLLKYKEGMHNIGRWELHIHASK